jgi:hypothetical protein
VVPRETAATPRSRSRLGKRELLTTLRKGDDAITLEKRLVYGVGEELILSVNAHWRPEATPRRASVFDN